MTTYLLETSPATITWGKLPHRGLEPALTVQSGDILIMELLSHEGLLEDQGRDPIRFFGHHGVASADVLPDAVAVAASSLPRDFDRDGPHVLIGPVRIAEVRPGDTLKIEILALTPRVPYGVIANRQGKGALIGEFPENTTRRPDASPADPDAYGNVSVFVPIERRGGQWEGRIGVGDNAARFPLRPFIGTLGVTPDSDEGWNSIPPRPIGGNIDITDLGVGSTLYLPVQIPGAGFFAGDPHFAQGNGEVALSALEGSLTARLRLEVIARESPTFADMEWIEKMTIFAETEEHWLVAGLDPDLDEAVKKAVRASVAFLSGQFGMERHLALACLSAATDFEISQVVDRTKGAHARIAKADFAEATELRFVAGETELPVARLDGVCLVPAKKLCDALELACAESGDAVRPTRGTATLEAIVESNRYAANGVERRLDVAPRRLDGQIYLPTRILPELFGVAVNWSTRGRVIQGRAVITT